MDYTTITEADIRNYIMKVDRVGGCLHNTPYMILEQLANGQTTIDEFRFEILSSKVGV